MNIKTWQDVLLEIIETDPADFSDRSNICISQKDLGDILKAAMDGQEVHDAMCPALLERDAEIETARRTADYWKAEHLAGNAVIAEQRKVLEQALEALIEYAVRADAEYGMGRSMEQIDADGSTPCAITAIREQLK